MTVRENGSSLVVGVVPKQPMRVASEALDWAQRASVDMVHFIYINPELIEIDGTLEPMDPDSLNDSWKDEQKALSDRLFFSHRLQALQLTFDAQQAIPLIYLHPSRVSLEPALL